MKLKLIQYILQDIFWIVVILAIIYSMMVLHYLSTSHIPTVSANTGALL